jgi:hypothetical protein
MKIFSWDNTDKTKAKAGKYSLETALARPAKAGNILLGPLRQD